MPIAINDTSIQRTSYAGSGSTQVQDGEKFRIKSGSEFILDMQAPVGKVWGINIIINIIESDMEV